uniref:non-specific serine/threonine protein kinase n=1 Tax=Salix viminalis TaxID=40686 RepID=A0A6N2KR84_SALVM
MLPSMARRIYRFLLVCFCASHALAADTLYQGGDSLKSSNTLVSKNGLFTLGFVRIGSAESSAGYLGIWYNSDTSHPFWLANRDKPIADNSGVLALDGSGNMKLTYSGGDLVDFYSSPSSTTNLTAVLEDTGNFVLTDANSRSDRILWQSFDDPTDTFLPGMKLGINHTSGQTRSLMSWLSEVVPTPAGPFTLEWDPNGKEFVIKRRDVIYWTSGPLRNNTFENIPPNLGVLDNSFINVSKADDDFIMFTVSANHFAPQDQKIFSISCGICFNDGARWTLVELLTLDSTNDTPELENDGNKGHNLKVYSAATIMAATNSFSADNKLGQGGFGPVYKGKLPDGREIAVKRLSRSSGQGLVEFKNELILIAKLQHMNLVRLVGCCIQGEEKMLVYEYMPNKSLDSFIFVESKRELLDWKKRFEIIEGIAQGLLYLHKYSRLRIIHRDLKAGNILLDENMNPKISDFGMARIFKINELEGNTNQIVGTRGYMSPEYVMQGIFSVKSDVFSFGVLLLEIAWELWKAGTPFELVDRILRESCSKDQVLRCIHVGLLCVEDNAMDRPNMSDVIAMLTSEAQLQLPKKPAFSSARSIVEETSSSRPAECGSINNVTMIFTDSGNFVLKDKNSGGQQDLWRSFDDPTDIFLPEMKLAFSSAGSVVEETSFSKSTECGSINIVTMSTMDARVLAIDGSGNMKLPYSGGDLVHFYSSPSSTTNLTAVLEDSGNFALKDTNSGGQQDLWRSFVLGINHTNVAERLSPNTTFTFEWILKERRADTLYQGGEALRFSSRLVSKNKLFTLEFVRLGSAESNASYLGICYQNDTGHPIWIANRDRPIADNSGVLEIDGDSGTMKVTYSGGDLFDFYSSQSPTSKLTATLEDSGNFVLKDANSRSDRILWQSFDDPTDTFLPGMKLGINYRTGQNWSLTSWMSDLVPAPGAFTLEWERDGQELVIKRRAEIYWRSGPLTSNGSFEAYRLNSRLDYSFLNVSNIDEDFFIEIRGKDLDMDCSFCGICSISGTSRYLVYLNELMTLDATNDTHELESDGNKGHNLKVYRVATIMAATNSFSAKNKLGQGGFGSVYKGKLPDGREVAVKRLSRTSRQGLVEFKNELILIAKLQHSNLVKLLGCCVEGEEKMLVYEYMPNKSLDSFIFDQSRRELLDWKKRFKIIEEIAQGLLYLHKYSRLRIIHRDLKASNILLNEDLSPKISDFGLARIFKINELKANTNRIVGTYGYMSPEYAMEGIFSVKSDAYSFGVLVLEIVSGRKNRSLLQIDPPLNLVGYAWELWKEGNQFELVDPTLRDSCSEDQVLRCIHVGLLCVEDNVIDRPTMSDVLSMLTSDAQLPLLKQPAFSCVAYSTDSQSNSSTAERKVEDKAEDKAEGSSINYEKIFLGPYHQRVFSYQQTQLFGHFCLKKLNISAHCVLLEAKNKKPDHVED